MKIQQTIVYDDKAIKALCQAFLKTKSGKRVQILLDLMGLVDLGTGILAAVTYGISSAYLMLGLAILFPVLAHVVYPIIIQKNSKKICAQLLGRRVTYIVADEGVNVKSEFGKGEYTWEDVQCIIKLKSYLVIRLVNGTALLLEKNRMSEKEITWVMSCIGH